MKAAGVQLDQLLEALQLDPSAGLSIVGAGHLAEAHHPMFGPDLGALVLGIASGTATRLRTVLSRSYPSDHPLLLVTQLGAGLSVEPVKLGDLGAGQPDSSPLALYIPALPVASSFEALQETVAHLRAPDGCPWDREQTHQSLRKHLLEETYETLEALDAGDLNALQEELGDLLLQVLLQSQIAFESGDFTAADVVAGIQAKLIRRHPHVFGDLQLDDVEQVLKNWEHFKQDEKGHPSNGVMQGIPFALPALAQALELQQRAARVGFDWAGIEGVLAKVNEELEEIQQAEDQPRQAAELGDLLFALVNFTRWIGVDPEAALQAANRRFRRRFDRMSESARQSGLNLDQLGIEALERLWEAAKQSAG